MQGKPVAEQEIGKQLLLETASYAESSVCRRRSLLHYFGEEYDVDNCGNCDNCLHPPKRIEAHEELICAIETILAVKEKFKVDHVVQVMLGNENNSVIKSYLHDRLEMFGCCRNREARFLAAVIRQGVIAGYIEKDIENYGVLHVTSAGRALLTQHDVRFEIVEDRDFSEIDDTQGTVSGAIDRELFGILREMRRDTARKLQLPPYVIFQDPSLDAMATTYPITLEELQNIPGVGPGKAKRYGQPFVDIIKKYVEENEIERPMDVRVRTIANKSKLKLYLISGIDRQISLDALAESQGLDYNELLDEIDAIVYSGTKINIDYFIRDQLDSEIVDELFQYFRDSETDSLEKAMEELGDEYTEEEIRLVRIKFLSEMGN